MGEKPAERFRRIQRSLEETGEMDSEADEQSAESVGDSPSPSSEPFHVDVQAAGEQGDNVKAEIAAVPSDEPAPVSTAGKENELNGPKSKGPARQSPEGEAPSKEPAKKRRVPAWRTPRRFLSLFHRKPPKLPDTSSTSRTRRTRRRSFGSCFARVILALIFLLTALLFVGAGIVIVMYYQVASDLPSVEDLKLKAAQFETTRIYDRNGDLLYEILDPNKGRRTYTPLAKISPFMVAATLAAEDKNFFSHPGFDPWAVLRAFVQNFQSGETVSGASTLTQQLARALLLDPQERSERSYLRKVREALLAIEITRRYSKEEILELYLNEFPYGNQAYGVEAAAETYFHTSADKLTLTQSSFLAGIPQAPSVYDIFTNREATLERQKQVLVMMVDTSQKQECIFSGNSAVKVCVTPEDAGAAWMEIQNVTFTPPAVYMRYPHWVNYVRIQLETMYDPQVIYRSGFQVYTTLDPGLQDSAEAILASQVESLAAKHISGGALVAIKPSTGEILVMVGSPDYYAQPAGQINMAVRPRQPGSSIKPLTYTAAFEKGWNPATLIWDVPSDFPPSTDPFDTNPPYTPTNYDNKFHGAVTVRTALANSYNIPAVKTLQYVGVYDDPKTTPAEGFLAFAKRLGITTLTRTDYGLALTLGGGEVTPLEITSVFGVFANGGLRMPPVAILKITTFDGKTVYEYQPPSAVAVVRPEHAFLISSILSDNEARTPMFGPNSVLNLPFPVAAKTGTTNDFKDNWTIGYTPDLAVGVWVGNPDNKPMEGTTGLSGAAPIWAAFMQEAIQRLTGGNPTPFVPPGGIIQKIVCALSGAEPSKFCPSTRVEYFAADRPPLPASLDLWREIYLDTFTKLRASATCNQNNQWLDLDLTVAVSDPAARRWLLENPDGKEWAKRNAFPDPIQFDPESECVAESPRPILEISQPHNNDILGDIVIEIRGKADATREFDHYTLEYGLGDDPQSWREIIPSAHQPMANTGKLADWNVAALDSGVVTIRLTVFSRQGGSSDTRIHINIRKPTPIPTLIPTITSTRTATAMPTATATPTITPPPTETFTEVNTPTPTETPPPTDTPTPAPSDTTTETPP